MDLDFSDLALPDIELVLVEGGSFTMGDMVGYLPEACRPLHLVTVDSFYICRYPVTQGLWEAIRKHNPSRFKGALRPVERISWLDAQEFIQQLNKRTGQTFRLPTEAEWEYAARGGCLSEGYRYGGSDKLKQVGWYDDNSNGKTQEVGQLLANELGLYDMSGNVYEWCADWYEGKYYQKCNEQGVVNNPCNNVEGIARARRGGSYFNDAVRCCSAYRNGLEPDERNGFIGFRLAMSVPSA